MMSAMPAAVSAPLSSCRLVGWRQPWPFSLLLDPCGPAVVSQPGCSGLPATSVRRQLPPIPGVQRNRYTPPLSGPGVRTAQVTRTGPAILSACCDGYARHAVPSRTATRRRPAPSARYRYGGTDNARIPGLPEMTTLAPWLTVTGNADIPGAVTLAPFRSRMASSPRYHQHEDAHGRKRTASRYHDP